jgi:hypothetical protein
LWLIDDFPVTSSIGIRVDDIAQVDLLTSPKNLVAFGEWGKCGVIAIHTKVRQPRTSDINALRSPITLQTDGGSVTFIPHSQPDFQGLEALYKDAPNMKKIMPLGFQKPAEFYAPKYDKTEQQIKPDLRTTIHWEPNLTTNEEGTATFSFYTADTPSTYTVLIEGITEDGKIVYKRERIVVGVK